MAEIKLRRGLILDRDGVVNHDVGYLYRAEECRFVDGIFEMARAFAARGFAIVIATNQSGIGRGLYGEADYAALMEWIGAEFGRHGVALAATYHCPDHPTQGVGIYRRENPWRKPGPGMMAGKRRPLDRQINAALVDVINRGADLYNSRDYAGCAGMSSKYGAALM